MRRCIKWFLLGDATTLGYVGSMGNLAWYLFLGLAISLHGQTVTGGTRAGVAGKPACIGTAELAGFDDLPGDRRKLLQSALAVASESPWLPYTARGSDPSQGGFDCSGAMYHVMRKAGLEPPRTALAQYQWLKAGNRLHEATVEPSGLDQPFFNALSPGDLLFWGRKSSPDKDEQLSVTHVAMYLGVEKDGNRHVMINSTDGRTYRGVKANGYGVYDFHLPKSGAKARFLGYGTPPGIRETGTDR